MKHFFVLNFKIINNKIKSLNLFSQIKIAFFLFIAFILFLGIYVIAWRLLSYLNMIPLIGSILLNKIMSLTFLTSFSMIIFSSLITSLGVIYQSKDISWLMSCPIPFYQIFLEKTFKTIIYSSWMVLIMLIPFILAYGQIKTVNIYFYFWIIFILVPFLALSSLLGILISIIITKFFPYRSSRDLFIFLGIIFITGIYITIRILQPEKLVRPDYLDIVAQYLFYLNAPSGVYLPSWWITAGIINFVSGNIQNSIFYTCILWSVLFFISFIVAIISKRFYYEGWVESQIADNRLIDNTPRYSERNQIRSLLDKDIRIFFRDTSQWSQLLILGAIMVVYLFSIYKLPLETIYLQNLVTFLNLGLIGFIISAVALRLVFPLISLEGQNLWLIRSSPISVYNFFLSKYIIGAIPIITIGISLTLISGIMLKSDKFILVFTLFSIILISISIVSLAICFGSVFVCPDMKNIHQIESSFGGVMYIIAAIFYLFLNISILSSPMRHFYKYKFSLINLDWSNYLKYGIIFLKLNILTIIGSMILSVKALERFER